MTNRQLLQAAASWAADNYPGVPVEAVAIRLYGVQRPVCLPATGFAPAPTAQPESVRREEPFIPSPLQELILQALEGKALRTDAIAAKCDCDRSKLFKPGGIKELQERGLVGWHRRLGFYSMQAPPPELEGLEPVPPEATTTNGASGHHW